MRARFEKVAVEANRSFLWQERRLARFDAPWHFHPEIELTLIVASRGRRFVGDSIEPFAEGDLVLLGPNLPHFWHSEGVQPRGARAHSIVVQFRQDFLGADWQERPEFAAIRRLLARAARGIHFRGAAARAAAEELCDLRARHGLSALLRLLAILDRLAHASGARLLASAAYAPSLDQRTEERLARVYAYLMGNFRERLSLTQIARVAAMNPTAFSRYFKRATGRNVSVFLNGLRLDHAAGLLRESGRTVADVAAEAGFVTLSNFNRCFRAHTGTTPREFRRRYADKGEIGGRFSSV